jgi:predicted nucleic acid-binding protein
MILVDSNVPMYLVGSDHPNKTAARRLLEDAVTTREGLVTDAEVFQEILHRYVAIQRTDAIDAAFEVLLAVVNEVYPIELRDITRARRLIETASPQSGGRPGLSARDAIHVAIAHRYDIAHVLSFDRGFDGVAGVVRLS